MDGLRAIAVLLIIFFHAGFELFQGGFIGVDIFFVISGFLITKNITALQENHSFSLIKFYEKRARRIIPALFFLILCTLPFAWFWMLPEELKELSKSIVSVAVFASNLLFYYQSGYFDSASELKPLLHTWSLGIEEQFYIVFPLILMLFCRSKKPIILVLACLSLIFAHWCSIVYPSFNFFMLPSRGFELLIGAIVALHNLDKKYQINHELGSVMGLFLIIYALASFDKNTPYPSLYTLIPIIGACLIIIYASSKNIVGKILGSKIFISIGLISYGAYLWHQPLLAFSRLRLIEAPSKTLLFLVCILSLIMGLLSKRYIEDIFRDEKKISQKLFTWLAIIFTLAFILIGFFGYIKQGFPERMNIPKDIINSLADNIIRKKCNPNIDPKTGDNNNFCILGDEYSSSISAAIFGDSHSDALLPVFDKVGQENQKKIVHISLGGCPPLLGIDVARGNYPSQTCYELSRRQYKYVKDNNIKVVFLIGRWSLYTDGDYNGDNMYFLTSHEFPDISKEISRVNFKKSLENTIKKYQELGVRIFLVAQVPHQKVDASLLYKKLYFFDVATKGDVIKKLSITKVEHSKFQHFSRDLFVEFQNKYNVKYVNLDDVLCDAEKCLIGNDYISNYRDDDHLSIPGALSTYKIIKSLLN